MEAAGLMPDFAHMSTPGPTASLPLNIGLGAVPAVGVNAATTFSTGEPSLIAIGAGINVLLDWLRDLRWFREQTWTIPALILISFGVAVGIWWGLGGDPVRAVQNGFGILANAYGNAKGAAISGVGILGQVADENKWRPQTYGATAFVRG